MDLRNPSEGGVQKRFGVPIYKKRERERDTFWLFLILAAACNTRFHETVNFCCQVNRHNSKPIQSMTL